MDRTCWNCKVTKSIIEFYANKDPRSKFRCYLCKVCQKQRSKKYREQNKQICREKKHKFYHENKEKILKQQKLNRKTNPDSFANSDLKKKYGIGLTEYNVLSVKQKGLCAICGNPPTRKRLDVDHCHTTNKIRGLLCSACNTGIGLFKDNPLLLKNAIEYLSNTSIP